jgi:hypothetical protein
MDANKERAPETKDVTTRQPDAPATSSDVDAGEFKIEVRKLDVPVRPRGVLAE